MSAVMIEFLCANFLVFKMEDLQITQMTSDANENENFFCQNKTRK